MISPLVKIAFQGDLAGYAKQTHLRIAAGARRAVEIHAANAKLALRQDTRPALGERIANAWRADIYPRSAAAHTHAPAVQVYTRAPKIVAAFGDHTIIRAKNAKYLAIPTDNTPRKGRRRATPVEVEAMFNQDLILIHGRGQQILAFVDAIKAKSGKGFRRATKRRTKDGRRNEWILMFVMVRQVGLDKKLNWKRIFVDLGTAWKQLFPAEIAKALSAGSN